MPPQILAAMKPQHIVSVVLVLVTVLVVAAFLIAIIVELRRTYIRLITILGAVGDTVTATDGLESVVSGIARDLAEGQAALASSVDRLEQRLGAGSSNGAASAGDPPPERPARGDVFTNY